MLLTTPRRPAPGADLQQVIHSALPASPLQTFINVWSSGDADIPLPSIDCLMHFANYLADKLMRKRVEECHESFDAAIESFLAEEWPVMVLKRRGRAEEGAGRMKTLRYRWYRSV